MKHTGYTPGPWCVDIDPEHDDGTTFSVFTDGTIMAEIAGRICESANARLIADAPRLAARVERLEFILRALLDGPNTTLHPNDASQIRAALAEEE